RRDGCRDRIGRATVRTGECGLPVRTAGRAGGGGAAGTGQGRGRQGGAGGAAGLHQTPEQIVETAIQEDADAIGLSVLSGAHMTLFRKVLELLAERDASDIVVFE